MIIEDNFLEASRKFRFDAGSLKNEGDYKYSATRNGDKIDIYAAPLVGNKNKNNLRIVEIYLNDIPCCIATDTQTGDWDILPCDLPVKSSGEKKGDVNFACSRYSKSEPIAVYSRIANSDNVDETLKIQKEYFERLFEPHPQYRISDMYIDIGKSGLENNRPEYKRMLADAEKGKFIYVVAKNVAKFGRDRKEIVCVTKRLLNCGVGVYFIDDGIDSLRREWRNSITARNSLDEYVKTLKTKNN